MTTAPGKSGLPENHPPALGAKVVFPEKTGANLMGDVAAGMAGADFATAGRENLGIDHRHR